MMIKKVIPVAFLVLLVLAWYTGISAIVEAPMEYKDHLEQAERYEREGRYQYAIEEYDAAIKYEPENQELYMKKMEDYRKLEDYKKMLDTCQYIAEHFQDNAEAYLLQLDYYIEERQFDTASEIARKAVKVQPKNEKIQKRYQELQGCYTDLFASYQKISEIRNDSAVVVNEDGSCGLISGDGSVKVQPQYESISLFSEQKESGEQLAAVKKDGNWYYMDRKGYKALVNDEGYDYLGEISEGIMVVGKKGKYGYAVWNPKERTYKALTKLVWDEAGTMFHGVAAVRKGEQWALIDSKGKELTKYLYDEIIMDEFKICSHNKVAFVKDGENYKLIDLEGRDITKAVYENVKPFSEGSLAAVCQKGKWGYIDTKGSLKIKYEYEDAGSFSKFYAPVKKDDLWGYIDKNNRLVLSCQFDGAKQFSDTGIAPVQVGEKWKMIRLYLYE